MKKPLILPEFKNEDEERDFWDKIDLSEYFEPSDFKRGVVLPNLKRTERSYFIKYKTLKGNEDDKNKTS